MALVTNKEARAVVDGHLAYCLAHADRADERAEELARAAVKSVPNEGLFHYFLGLVLLKRNQAKEAEELIEKSLPLRCFGRFQKLCKHVRRCSFGPGTKSLSKIVNLPDVVLPVVHQLGVLFVATINWVSHRLFRGVIHVIDGFSTLRILGMQFLKLTLQSVNML